MSRFQTTVSGQARWASDTAAPTAVTSTITSTLLLAANVNRQHASVMNDSTAVLYVLWGTGTASATNYTVRIAAGGFYEVPAGLNPWTGALTGVWASANGFAYVTEAV